MITSKDLNKMKKVDIVKVVKSVQIFEKGDLIMFTMRETGENLYGVVIEDQDPNDIDNVSVRSINSGEIEKWDGVHDDDCIMTPCTFVMHLDKVAIDIP